MRKKIVEEIKIFLEELRTKYDAIGQIDGVTLATLIGGLSDNDDKQNREILNAITHFCESVYKKEAEKNERAKRILRKTYYEREN